MINKDQCICIGFISKPHGVKGEVSIMLNDGFYSDSIHEKFFLLDIDNGLVPFEIESFRKRGDKSILVHFEDINNEEDARKLVSIEVYSNSADIEESSDVQMGALVGYEVIDQNEGNIGIITNINEITNNPLFEIDFNGTEILIPIHPDLILEINAEGKIINVDLPEGLIDVYLDSNDDDDDEWD